MTDTTVQSPPARPIPAIGVHYDVPAATYFSWDAVNASLLKEMTRSAARCRYMLDHPNEPTPAMLLGTAIHTAILEPGKLAKRFLVSETCSATTGKGAACDNAGKVLSGGNWYCGVHARSRVADDLPPVMDDDGNLIPTPVLTRDQMATVQAMVIASERNPAIRRLLEPCRKEVCIVWDDPATGARCKARLDAYNPPEIVDVKTCQDASEDEFSRVIGDRNYDMQAAFYLDAGTSLDGELHEAFYFIALETPAPFATACYKLKQDAVALGRYRYRKALADYLYCQKENFWPAYHDGQIRPIGTTRYFFEKESKK